MTLLALQPWLNAVGLGLDFVGVLLLAFEWVVAMRAERREADIAAREEQVRPRPNVPRPSGPHQEVFDDMKERRRVQDRLHRGHRARLSRRGWFVAALLLVALGFLLQIIGSVPLGAAG